MSEMETTCLDYIMRCGIRGMEDIQAYNWYLEQGYDKRLLDNADKKFKELELLGMLMYGDIENE